MLLTLKDLLVSISNYINKIVGKIVMLFLFILFMLVMLQVVFRFLFSMGFPWIDEISRFLNIWIALLGASIGVRYGNHVGVAFFTNMIPEKARKIFNFFTRIVTVVLLSLITNYCYGYFAASTSSSPSLRLSYKWPKVAIFVGFSIMLIHLVRFILEDIVDFVNKDFSIDSDDLIANIEEG